MTTIIDGKKLRDEILVNVKKEVEKLPFQPIFCDILVGEDPVLKQYVNMKNIYAKKVGIGFYDAIFPLSINTEELVEEIKKINNIKNICGIIVQLPLPPHLDHRKILDSIKPELDVDCLGSINSEKFYKEEFDLCFPTVLACIALLDSIKISLENKSIVILGQGELVGKPINSLLKHKGFKTTVITSDTKNKEEIIKKADIIISGMGNGKFITENMIKEGVIIIDAGTSESNSGIVGDVDLESVMGIAGFVSPVPGGVGPVTVAMLLNNVLQVAKKKDDK